jgi:hypothetical protein
LKAEKLIPEVTDNEPSGTLLGGLVQLSPNSQKVVREGVEPPPGQQQKRFIKRGLCCL